MQINYNNNISDILYDFFYVLGVVTTITRHICITHTSETLIDNIVESDKFDSMQI